MNRMTLIAVSTITLLWSATAQAQGAADDGSRFRGGIALTGGFESVSFLSGPMFGVDGRLGLQLNDMLGFYVDSQLAFGSLSTSGAGAGVSGLTGTFSVAAMGEVTLMDRFFGGLGFGYGVLNNPSGPMFEARVGAYPFMGLGDDGVRRKGLMLGVDLRTIFSDVGTGVLVTGAIGYEAF